MIFNCLQSAFQSFNIDHQQAGIKKDEKFCKFLLFAGGILIPFASIAATIMNR